MYLDCSDKITMVFYLYATSIKVLSSPNTAQDSPGQRAQSYGHKSPAPSGIWRTPHEIPCLLYRNLYLPSGSLERNTSILYIEIWETPHGIPGLLYRNLYLPSGSLEKNTSILYIEIWKFPTECQPYSPIYHGLSSTCVFSSTHAAPKTQIPPLLVTPFFNIPWLTLFWIIWKEVGVAHNFMWKCKLFKFYLVYFHLPQFDRMIWAKNVRFRS